MRGMLRSFAVAAAGVVAGLAIAHTSDAVTPPSAPASSEPPAAAVGLGPSRVDAGVPAGFARTRAGAVAASASYVRTGAAVMAMSDVEVRAAAEQMAATASADEQANDLLRKLRALRATLDGTAATYRQAVLAARVDAYDGDRARVAVWHVGVLAAGERFPPQAGWSTSTFELVWERGDWKVWAETIAPGPAPILDESAPPATAEVYDDRLAGFTQTGAT